MTIQGLQILDGEIQNNNFVLKRILIHKVYAIYSIDDLRSMARLINDEPFNMIIDKEKELELPKKQAIRLKEELYIIANHIEKSL